MEAVNPLQRSCRQIRLKQKTPCAETLNELSRRCPQRCRTRAVAKKSRYLLFNRYTEITGSKMARIWELRHWFGNKFRNFMRRSCVQQMSSHKKSTSSLEIYHLISYWFLIFREICHLISDVMSPSMIVLVELVYRPQSNAAQRHTYQSIAEPYLRRACKVVKLALIGD